MERGPERRPGGRGKPDQLVEALQGVSRRLIAITARALAATEEELGTHVSLPEYRTLVLLFRDAELSPHTIADELGVTRPAVTRIVGRMTEVGLITRRTDDDDARQAWLRLTARGEQIVKAVTRERERRLRPALKGLSARERDTLLDVLWRIYGSLEQPAASATP